MSNSAARHVSSSSEKVFSVAEKRLNMAINENIS